MIKVKIEIKTNDYSHNSELIITKPEENETTSIHYSIQDEDENFIINIDTEWSNLQIFEDPLDMTDIENAF